MNAVSYEIALRLKKAGFPKPEQLLSSATRGWVYATQLPGGINAFEARIPLRESYLFAPTIADILQLIPDFFVKASYAGFGFYCARLDPTTAKWSKNIHDAAALAWLALNGPEDSDKKHATALLLAVNTGDYCSTQALSIATGIPERIALAALNAGVIIKLGIKGRFYADQTKGVAHIIHELNKTQ